MLNKKSLLLALTVANLAVIAPRAEASLQCRALLGDPAARLELATVEQPEVFQKETLRSMVTRLIRKTVNPKILWAMDKVLANHQNQTLELRSKNGPKDQPAEVLSLEMGKRLGYGMNGSVYVIRSLTDGKGETLLSANGEYVAKFPHSLKALPDRPITKMNRMNALEADLADAITRAWEKHREAALLSGRELPALPLVPTVLRLSTAEGEILVKPKVNGSDIKKLGEELGKEPDAKRKEALKKVFELSEELENVLFMARDREPVLGQIISDRKLDLDINPRNLVWLDKAETTRLRETGVDVGFDEGFAFFELTLLAIPDGRTEYTFLKEFNNALSTN